jgi:hypothetical protein
LGDEELGMGESEVAALLCELEGRLLLSATRKSREMVAAMLADGFREVGQSGRVFSKEEVVAELAVEEEARISMAGCEVQVLSEGIALVTYRARREQDGVAAVESLRSSVWKIEEGRWRMVFHQGTRVV